MATVGVTIAGRTYRMACGEGEEVHLQELATHVDKTLTGLRGSFGDVGDQRLVIMTAITISDELSEAKRRISELEREMEGLKDAGAKGESARDGLAAEIAVSLDAAAERIERIAQSLNEAGRS